MPKFCLVTKRGRNCSKCKTFKSWAEFHRATAHPTGYRSSCKDCDKEMVRARLERTRNSILHCNKCGQDKHRDLFNNLTRSRTGKQPHCKQCGIEYYLSKKADRQNAKTLIAAEPELVVEQALGTVQETTTEPFNILPAMDQVLEAVREITEVKEVHKEASPVQEETPVHVGPVSTIELDVAKAQVAFVYDLVVAAMRDRTDAKKMNSYLEYICTFLVNRLL